MSGVRDRTCDLVFLGQNLEHLWPEEVAGFLAEAARVTKLGGHLVVDSPNRLLPKPLNWSHPEHTVELATDEATSSKDPNLSALRKARSPSGKAGDGRGDLLPRHR